MRRSGASRAHAGRVIDVARNRRRQAASSLTGRMSLAARRRGLNRAARPAERERRVLGLRCRECGAEYEQHATHVCESCFGPLDVSYDYELIRRVISRERIAEGPPTMWRYRDLLPLEDDVHIVSLGEGFTPLGRAERLGAEVRVRHVYLRDGVSNPTKH